MLSLVIMTALLFSHATFLRMQSRNLAHIKKGCYASLRLQTFAVEAKKKKMAFHTTDSGGLFPGSSADLCHWGCQPPFSYQEKEDGLSDITGSMVTSYPVHIGSEVIKMAKIRVLV